MFNHILHQHKFLTLAKIKSKLIGIENSKKFAIKYFHILY